MTFGRTLLLGAATAGAVLAVRRLRARLARDFTWEDKTVVITGGSRGLGLVLARECLDHGARVAICARDQDELERAERDLREHGDEVFAYRSDITDPGDVHDFIAAVQRRYGAVDVLVNNAGNIQVGPMEAMTFDDLEKAMDVHFWGPVHATLAVLPGMRAVGGGHIVNISSIGGKVAVPHLLPYTASKFALSGLSEGLAMELPAQGIGVTTVYPGLLRTGSPTNALFKGQNDRESTWFMASASLPVITMSARRAARQIMAACARGDPEIVLGLPHRMLARFHGVFPGTTIRLMALVNRRVLPEPGGDGTSGRRGAEARSSRLPSWLTALSDRAARRNNELPERPAGRRARATAPVQ